MTFQLDTSGEWRPVVGYEGYYEVTADARVRSVPRTVIGRDGRDRRLQGLELRQKVNRSGYTYVNVSKDGLSRALLVHRMVAQAFLPNPEGKAEINHLDCDKSNNTVSNLCWSTRGENQAHAGSNMRMCRVLDADQIGAIRKQWPTLKVGEKGGVAKGYGITREQLRRVGTGRAHRHVATTPEVTPFVSGYIEALRDCLPPEHRDAPLAPATLGRILEDCQRGLVSFEMFPADVEKTQREWGAWLWEARQRGDLSAHAFPPQVVSLSDDGLVYLTEGVG